ncbi:MAG TPA: hypothetical protein VH144_00905 [Candidatus Saccharimonadales bacterium]|nr:hypothetical protein [Candidatus Saccharimonadales bacterium]
MSEVTKADVTARLPRRKISYFARMATPLGAGTAVSTWATLEGMGGTAADTLAISAESFGTSLGAIGVIGLATHLAHRHRQQQARSLHERITRTLPDQRFELYSQRQKGKSEILARWYPSSESTCSTAQQLQDFADSLDPHVDGFVLPTELVDKEVGIVIDEEDLLRKSRSQMRVYKQPESLRQVTKTELATVIEDLQQQRTTDRLTTILTSLQATQPTAVLPALLETYLKNDKATTPLKSELLRQCRSQLEQQLESVEIQRQDDGTKQRSYWQAIVTGQDVAYRTNQHGKFETIHDVLRMAGIQEIELELLFAGKANQLSEAKHTLVAIGALYRELIDRDKRPPSGERQAASLEVKPMLQERLLGLKGSNKNIDMRIKRIASTAMVAMVLSSATGVATMMGFEYTKAESIHEFNLQFAKDHGFLEDNVTSDYLGYGVQGNDETDQAYINAFQNSPHLAPYTLADTTLKQIHYAAAVGLQKSAAVVGVDLGVPLGIDLLGEQSSDSLMMDDQRSEIGNVKNTPNHVQYMIQTEGDIDAGGYWSTGAMQDFCGMWYEGPAQSEKLYQQIENEILNDARAQPYLKVFGRHKLLRGLTFQLPVRQGTFPYAVTVTDIATGQSLPIRISTDGAMTFEVNVTNQVVSSPVPVNISYRLAQRPPTQPHAPYMDATCHGKEQSAADTEYVRVAIAHLIAQHDPELARLTDPAAIARHISQRFKYGLSGFDQATIDALKHPGPVTSYRAGAEMMARTVIDGVYRTGRANCNIANTLSALTLISKGRTDFWAVSGYGNWGGNPKTISSSEGHFYLMTKDGQVLDATPSSGITSADAAFFKESTDGSDSISFSGVSTANSDIAGIAEGIGKGTEIVAGSLVAIALYRRRRTMLDKAQVSRQAMHRMRLGLTNLGTLDSARRAIDEALYAPDGVSGKTTARFSGHNLDDIDELVATLPVNSKSVEQATQKKLDRKTQATVRRLLQYKRMTTKNN